jgi:hypothetical protein
VPTGCPVGHRTQPAKRMPLEAAGEAAGESRCKPGLTAGEPWNAWASLLAGLPPECLELRRRKLGVSDRVLDCLVAEVVLDGTGIVAGIGQCKAAGMSKHVEVDREAEELVAITDALHKL